MPRVSLLKQFSRFLIDQSTPLLIGAGTTMKTYTAVVEKDKDTGLYVGYVPGFPGAHSQGETLDELRQNLQEVIEMLLEDEIPQVEAEFVGTQQITVA